MPKQSILEICRNRKKILYDIKAKVKSILTGEHPSRILGLGIEFDNVREYHYGDDIRRIDWNFTARHPPEPTGERLLYVKEYREEKNLDVLLVLDESGSMDYREKVATGVKAALILSDLAQRRNDRVGLICFRHRVETFLAPARSGEQAYKVLRALCVGYRAGGDSNLRVAAADIAKGLKRRTMVHLITDTNHEPDDIAYFAHVMWSRHHVTNVILVADPSEMSLPAVGWVTLMESEEMRSLTTDTVEMKQAYDSEVSRNLMETMRNCRLFGAKFLILTTVEGAESKIAELAMLYRRMREVAYV